MDPQKLKDINLKTCIIGDAGHINLINWVRYLANVMDEKIHVLTFNEPCEKVNGMIVHILRNYLYAKKSRYISSIPEVRNALNIINPNILIGYRINSYGLMAVMTGFHPVILIAQGSDIFHSRYPILQKLLLRYVIKKADLLHTWAPHMGDRLIDCGAVQDKILVLPKGVDITLFRPSDNRTSKQGNNLISTRQLRKSYNHDCVLNALPIILNKIPMLTYLVCGEGEYRAELKVLAKKLGIEGYV